MPLPFMLPFAIKGIAITWKTVALIAGSGAVGKAIHYLGKQEGRYEGEMIGRAAQAATDESKFRDLKDEVEKQKETFQSEKKELDQILEYYETCIDVMHKKFNLTDEEKEELDRVVKVYEMLRQLKKNKSTSNTTTHAEKSPDYQKATISLLYFLAGCDGAISDEEKMILELCISAIINDDKISDNLRQEISDLKEKKYTAFSDVKKYLDAITYDELTELKELAQAIISASDGISKAESAQYRIFLKYYLERGEAQSSGEEKVSFRMMVEEARIIAEYTVITGRIKEGKIGSRDDLTIIKSNGERIQVAAVWIRSNGSFQKHAEIGDRVEICLKNALKLSRGDMVVKLESIPSTQNHNAPNMVILDFNAKANTHESITIEGNSLRCSKTEISGVIFRNYPRLSIDELQIRNCKFENCITVQFDECEITDTCFDNIEDIFVVRTSIEKCIMEHLHCDNDCILSAEDTSIDGCTFRDIELRNESYLIDGFGDTWVENCLFENIRTDREDREIFFCEETVGKLIKKKKQFCIVNEDSCSGLEQIKIIV